MNGLNLINYNKIAFQGSHKKTEQGNRYYHTEWGEKTGIASTVLATSIPIIAAYKEPKIFKYSLLAPLIVAPSILLGKLADKVTNEDNKQTVDMVKKYGIKRAYNMDEKIKVSKRGQIYKKTENGTSIGSLATVVVLVPLALYKLIKDKKVPRDLDVFFETLLVPGGLLFGNLALSDFIANMDFKLNA